MAVAISGSRKNPKDDYFKRIELKGFSHAMNELQSAVSALKCLAAYISKVSLGLHNDGNAT